MTPTCLLSRTFFVQRICLVGWLLFSTTIVSAAVANDAAAIASVQWPQSLFETPAATAAPEEYEEAGLEAAFLEGPPYRGKASRVFVYYGIPPRTGNAKCPGMVLVHGGGGTAFADWVRLWNGRGYAAIAMDTCGCLPKGEHANRPRHEAGGPAGWGAFTTAMEPVTEQWVYHAVAAVVLSHSFLRSLPEVDPERVGITGISWGGYLTCLVAAVDARFRLAAPVYGCGFLGENSAWSAELDGLGETGRRWLALWDPKHYLPTVNVPMLWVTGTNDFAYPLDSLQKSYRLPAAPHTLCIRPRMPHGHGGAGENPEEIRAFADHLLLSGAPLTQITAQHRDGNGVWVSYTSVRPLANAELLFTKDGGQWQERLWETLPAAIHPEEKHVSAELPQGVTVYYLNLMDAENRVVSSEHEELR